MGDRSPSAMCRPRPRRRLTVALTAVLLLLAGCGGPRAQVVTDDLAGVYIAVLKRYLTAANEKPQEAGPADLVYVLDRTAADAGGGRVLGPEDPMPIGAEDQRRIVAAVSDGRTVRFAANREDVTFIVDGPAGPSPHPLACRQVRDGGIFIELSAPVGEPDEVQVGIRGYMSCTAGTFVTYDVERGADGWRVTGIDGGIGSA